MKKEHISLLQCIECGNALELATGRPVNISTIETDGIESGVLRCISCNAEYPVIEHVGVFFRQRLMSSFLNAREKEVCRTLGIHLSDNTASLQTKDEVLLKVTNNWSYQWNTFYAIDEKRMDEDAYLTEDACFKFIPIQKQSLVAKRVVVWCGGGGKEAYHISKNKPALIILVEIGDEIYSAGKLAGGHCDMLLIRCDMLESPLRKGIADYSICDHALQHISDHKAGFSKIIDVLRNQGEAVINVYSHENNFIMTGIIEPLKSFIHLLPLKGQEYLSFFLAAVVYAVIHAFYVPANRILPVNVCRKIFLFDHMMYWSASTFRFVWLACFDLIHAPISHHFRRDELIAMADANNVKVVTLNNTNGTTWSMVARKDG